MLHPEREERLQAGRAAGAAPAWTVIPELDYASEGSKPSTLAHSSRMLIGLDM